MQLYGSNRIINETCTVVLTVNKVLSGQTGIF